MIVSTETEVGVARVAPTSHRKGVETMTGTHWTKEEIAFLKENYLKLGAKECARQLGRSRTACNSKIRKVGGGRPPIGPRNDWSEEEVAYVKKNYQRLSWEEMQEALGRTKMAIFHQANSLGMKRYVEPAPFFEEWTEESAYVIGFFAADGWVNKRGPKSIRIGFSQKDGDILFAIRKAIGVGQVYVKNNGMHRYYIQSMRTYERLCSVFGQDVCNKSHTLQWPDIPDEFVRHFIRGAVDGDGSFFRNNTDRLWRFSYATSSQAFIDALVDTIKRLTGIELNPGINRLNVWHARAAGAKAVCLADWLYRDATIALERKAALAQEMMNSKGMAYWNRLTPKMRAMFPHILDRYEIVERAAQ